MITLFIDTSSTDVSIAIIKDNILLSKITKSVPNEHSVYATSFLDKVIKDANLEPTDINRVMVVNGPGSFTGVRIGVTIAKVYAYLLNIEVICISSLKMMSISNKHDYCLSLIDAHHNNYYLGLYDKENNEVINEQFNTKEEVLKLINNYNPTIVSDKDITLDDIKIEKQELDILEIVKYYQNHKTISSHLVVPNYLKLPQAMEEKK